MRICPKRVGMPRARGKGHRPFPAFSHFRKSHTATHMRHSALLLVAAACWSAVGCCPDQGAPYVCQMARTPQLSEAVPRYGDVCFSSRWPRPRNPSDTLDTFEAAQAFHADWLLWCYTTDTAFIRRARTLGLKVQTALSPSLPDKLPSGQKRWQQGRLRDSSGRLVTAPWMASWSTWWGCVNSPAFQQTWRHHLAAALQAGAHSIQVDDPAMSVLLLRNAWARVCFCAWCRQKAVAAGTTPTEIQEASVRAFHLQMKRWADSLAGRHVPFSCNNFRGDWKLFPHALFDFGLAEVPVRRANPEYIYSAIRTAHRLGKGQVFSFVAEKTWLVQKVIATVYACGGNALVPWDVWQGPGKARYFGRPAEFAPLFGFVKAMHPWLEGYEDACYASTQDDPRWFDPARQPVSFPRYEGHIHVWLRARPQQTHAPVVAHVVDWDLPADTIRVLLDPKRFFPARHIGRIACYSPAPYDLQKHQSARLSDDYSELKTPCTCRRHLLPDGRILLEIPPLDWHWAMLIIYPPEEE